MPKSKAPGGGPGAHKRGQAQIKDNMGRLPGQKKPFTVEIRVLDKQYLGDKNARQRRSFDCDGYLALLNAKNSQELHVLIQGELPAAAIGAALHGANKALAAGIATGISEAWAADKEKKENAE